MLAWRKGGCWLGSGGEWGGRRLCLITSAWLHGLLPSFIFVCAPVSFCDVGLKKTAAISAASPTRASRYSFFHPPPPLPSKTDGRIVLSKRGARGRKGRNDELCTNKPLKWISGTGFNPLSVSPVFFFVFFFCSGSSGFTDS